MAKKNKIILPDNLGETAKKFIESVISSLEKSDKLDKIDSASLFILAKSFNNYLIANEHLESEGMTIISDRGNVAISPYFKIARDSEKTILALLTEYGLTLKSRQKLKGIDAEVEESPLETFIKSGTL